MQSTQTLQGVVLSLTSMEVSMNSIERTKEYSEVAQERDHTTAATTTVDNWPARGQVSFVGVSARYRPSLPLVLKDFSVTIDAGTKVGFCGRTGSGKSTSMLLLMRIMELEAGQIIDGVNIANVGLDRLRSAIAMLPQDPLLFDGKLRDNLSPFGEHTDAEIWNALQKAQMKTAIRD